MIITERKSLGEILDIIGDAKNVFIIGCSDCTAACQTGGSEQVKEMARVLAQHGKNVTGTLMIDSPCDRRVSKRDLKLVARELADTDVVLSLSCGLGTQSIGRTIETRVVPGNNTRFYGIVEHIGEYEEACCGCDSCVLHENDGNCPKVRRKQCVKCGRIVQWDSKFCDMCGSQELVVGGPRMLVSGSRARGKGGHH